MAFDVKKWLVEEMKFTPEQAEQMAPSFTGDRVTALESGYVGKAERDRLAAEQAGIEKTRTELKALDDKLNKEMAEWATLSASEKAKATELQDSIEKAQQRALVLEQKLTRLASEHGMDPKTILEGAPIVPEPKKPEAPVLDPNKFVSTDVFGNVAVFNLELAATMPYIVNEHKRLFGADLDPRDIVKTIKERAGKKDAVVDPMAIWEEKYGVSAKREELAQAARAEEIRQAELRGEQRARTQAALPGPTVPGKHAPVFQVRDQQGNPTVRTSKLSRPQPGETVNRAAAALASHKYRQAS